MMPRGLAIHIGLNAVDAAHYQGWDGELDAAEHDARDMRAIADALGYETTLLLTRQASGEAVCKAIDAVAHALAAGDAMLLSFAGYGGRLPNGRRTWALYDRQLLEDELQELLARFERGVRVFVLADTCHGAPAHGAYQAIHANPALRTFSPGRDTPRFRDLPADVEQRTHAAHRPLYDAVRNGGAATVSAGLLFMSACQENQLAAETDHNGLFTATLLSVWQGGRFKGDYRDLHRAIQHTMPPWQSPALCEGGARDVRLDDTRPLRV